MKGEDTALRTMVFSIASHLILVIIKGVSGIIGNSFALIADAIESSSDLVSSIFIYFGLRYAKKPADELHPYGHGKIEPVLTFIVVAFLIVSAVLITMESIKNIMIPHASPKPWTLIVLGGIILWKELTFQYIKRKSLETHSGSLKADAWHHRSDAITSFTAFIGILFTVIFGKEYYYADDIAAIVASILLLYNSYKIFRPALGEILDEQRYDSLERRIRFEAIKVKGIKGTGSCTFRKTGTKYHVDLISLVDGDLSVTEGHTLAHELESHLRKHVTHLGQIFIHVEPY